MNIAGVWLAHLSPIDKGDTLSNDDIRLPMVGETRNAEDSAKKLNTSRMLMLEWHFICRVGHRLDLVFIAKTQPITCLLGYVYPSKIEN